MNLVDDLRVEDSKEIKYGTWCCMYFVHKLWLVIIIFWDQWIIHVNNC